MHVEHSQKSLLSAILPPISKAIFFFIFFLEASSVYSAVSLGLIKTHIIKHFPVVGFLFVFIIFGIGLMAMISKHSPIIVVLGISFLAVFKATVHYAPTASEIHTIPILFIVCASLPAVFFGSKSHGLKMQLPERQRKFEGRNWNALSRAHERL